MSTIDSYSVCMVPEQEHMASPPMIRIGGRQFQVLLRDRASDRTFYPVFDAPMKAIEGAFNQLLADMIPAMQQKFRGKDPISFSFTSDHQCTNDPTGLFAKNNEENMVTLGRIGRALRGDGQAPTSDLHSHTASKGPVGFGTQVRQDEEDDDVESLRRPVSSIPHPVTSLRPPVEHVATELDDRTGVDQLGVLREETTVDDELLPRTDIPVPHQLPLATSMRPDDRLGVELHEDAPAIPRKITQIYLDHLYREKLLEADATFSPFGKTSLDNYNVIYLREDDTFESCTPILEGRPTLILKKASDQLLIPDHVGDETKQKAMRIASTIQAMCFLSWLQDNPTQVAQEFPKFEANHPVAGRAIRAALSHCKIEEMASHEEACKAIFASISSYEFPHYFGYKPEIDYGEETESLREALHGPSEQRHRKVKEDDLESLGSSVEDLSVTRRSRAKKSVVHPESSGKERRRPKTLHEINMEIIEKNQRKLDAAAAKKSSARGLSGVVQRIIDKRIQQTD